MAKKKVKEYTLVGVARPLSIFHDDGIPVIFMSHKTGQQFTLNVSGLDFEYDVTFPDDFEPDMNLAQEAVSAIQEIVDAWSNYKTNFINNGLNVQRVQRRQQQTLLKN